MGGHGGLNILPQKRWNVYNYDNREKVRQDEEAAAREEHIKREQSRKRDAEFRLERLRQARGLASSSQTQAAAASAVSESESESNHINLFEGIRIFDPVRGGGIEGEDDKKGGIKRMKLMKKEATPKVVTAEDEKYRLGYGIVGKGVKLPWYMSRPSDNANAENHGNDDVDDDKFRVKKERGKKSASGKKTLEVLREERLKRERREKERERALVLDKGRRDGTASKDGIF